MINPPGSAGRKLRKRGLVHRLPALFCLLFAWLSCRAAPVPVETPLPAEVPVLSGIPPPPPQQGSSGGLVDEIRFNTEKASPSSILRALEIIRSRGLGSTEFGRVMNAVNVTLLKTLYPSVQAELPQLDPPLTHIYSRILREAERGVYVAPQANSTDYLEHVLPFLAYYPRRPADGAGRTETAARATTPERFLAVLPDLERAARLNGESVLAGYFMGVVYEQANRPDDASRQFTRVWEQFPDCFPAALGLARLMEAQGRLQDAAQLLSDLASRFPDNLQIKRQIALVYYRLGEWSRAETAVAEILQRNNRDGEFVLMRAHIFVEQGQFVAAQAPLDIYAAINPGNKLYLFLRARVQAEGFNNRDAALNYLRAIMRSPPADSGGIDDRASLYAARLLLESPRPADQNEGRDLLTRLLAAPSPPLEAAALALDDAVRREAWANARTHLNRLLNERRSSQDLLAAYMLERAQGNNAAALSFARELNNREPSNEEGIIAYATALIDTGRRDEASRIIEGRLNNITAGPLRGRYFFLRSRLRPNEELMMTDLRSSLFEDPRNLDSLIAMFEIYHRRRDERRAVYYLRQALAIAPNNPRLRQHEAEYASALGRGF